MRESIENSPDFTSLTNFSAHSLLRLFHRSVLLDWDLLLNGTADGNASFSHRPSPLES